MSQRPSTAADGGFQSLSLPNPGRQAKTYRLGQKGLWPQNTETPSQRPGPGGAGGYETQVLVPIEDLVRALL
jgi:hypothetical protein